MNESLEFLRVFKAFKKRRIIGFYCKRCGQVFLSYNLVCVKSVELLRDYLMGSMALKIERKNSLERGIIVFCIVLRQGLGRDFLSVIYSEDIHTSI